MNNRARKNRALPESYVSFVCGPVRIKHPARIVEGGAPSAGQRFILALAGYEALAGYDTTADRGAEIQMSNLSILVVAGVLVVLVAAAVRYNVGRLHRSKRAMEEWLGVHGYTVVAAQLCWWPRGPYSSAIARHLPVYRVTARDQTGDMHRGWICCLPFSDQAEAKWETNA